MIPTFDTRRESNETVDRVTRYAQILEIMEYFKCPLSAKQIAVQLHIKEYTPTSERNFVSPRLTELMYQGIVKQIGKKRCVYTGKMVTVFQLMESSKEVQNASI